jgi:hypothetical protein
MLVGLLLFLPKAYGILDFVHDPTSKNKLETREGLRISK